MAVFEAYSDESERFERVPAEFLFGGYIASHDEWPWIATAWQERVLDGPPKIPYLHMREIRNDEWRQRYGISLNDAECRIDEATRIMDSFGNMAAIASEIRRSDLKDIFHVRYRHRKNVPLGLNEPDYFAFLAYAIFTLGQVHKKWPEAERVDFVVSRKKKVSHHIGEFRNEMTKLMEPPLADLIGDLIPANMEERLPLQSADVLLWHAQRFFAAGRDQYKMHPVDRMRSARLIQDGMLDGTIHAWERSELETVADKWERSGLIPPTK